MNDETLIPRHGGYRKLKSFQIARLIYDLTVRFCDHHVDRRSRTHDQMVQAARSGVQNIAEGSLASGTSKKTELKLTNVARASLEELRLDYEDYLRQRQVRPWAPDHPALRRFRQAALLEPGGSGRVGAGGAGSDGNGGARSQGRARTGTDRHGRTRTMRNETLHLYPNAQHQPAFESEQRPHPSGPQLQSGFHARSSGTRLECR